MQPLERAQLSVGLAVGSSGYVDRCDVRRLSKDPQPIRLFVYDIEPSARSIARTSVEVLLKVTESQGNTLGSHPYQGRLPVQHAWAVFLALHYDVEHECRIKTSKTV